MSKFNLVKKDFNTNSSCAPVDPVLRMTLWGGWRLNRCRNSSRHRLFAAQTARWLFHTGIYFDIACYGYGVVQGELAVERVPDDLHPIMCAGTPEWYQR